jgi:N-acetyl-anhydromuramyl-L-alanine amidase AmpD
MANGTCSQDDARALFQDVYGWTQDRAVEIAGPAFLDDFPTRQYRGPGGFTEQLNGWRHGQPVGVCDHATADTSLASTLRWFSSHAWSRADGTKGPAGASAAIVIDQDGTPYCLIDWWNGRADWHEPQLNGLCVGIEHVNAGELRQDQAGRWVYWPGGWTRPYGQDAILPPEDVGGWRGCRAMAPYTREQIVTNAVLKRAFVQMVPAWPEMFVDHAMYRDDKRDMGPLWPLAMLRDLAFQRDPIAGYSFVQDNTPVPGAPVDAWDHRDLEAATEHFVPRDMPAPAHEFATQSSSVLWVQLSLAQLGYPVAPDGQVGRAYVEAVRRYQQDHGLVADGIAGPTTRRDLAGRLAARR